MNTQPSAHDQVRDLLGVFVMGIAEPFEAQTVEQHVARCITCHTELQSLIATAEALSFVPDQHNMPVCLHASILSAISETETPIDATPEMATKVESESSPMRIWRRDRPQLGIALRVALPAAACLVVALGAVGVQTSRLVDRDQQLGSLRAAAASQASDKSIIATSHVVKVKTSGALSKSTVELVDIHGAGLLITKNLPEPPTGYEWRVWGVERDHDMHPMGGLDPKLEQGMGLQPIIGLHDQPFDAIAITLERSNAGDEHQGPVVGWGQMV